MFLADRWKEYELIDVSGGEKLERWGKYLLIRPDPQIVWSLDKSQLSPPVSYTHLDVYKRQG